MSEVRGIDIVNAKIERMLAVGGLDREAYLELANILKSEMQENFRVGGRPTAWKPSERVRRKGGQTLRLTGRLMNSLTAFADDTGGGVGTNVKYAAIHNFGGDIVRHAHSRIGVEFRRPKRGKFAGKQIFAKRGTGSIKKNISVGQYIITIDPRPFDYISPQGRSDIIKAAGRRLIVGATDG